MSTGCRPFAGGRFRSARSFAGADTGEDLRLFAAMILGMIMVIGLPIASAAE
jgi:hypothetical protein